MKPKFIAGISLITALALASCSTSRLNTAKVQNDDDVYYTKTTAGDAIMDLPLPQDAYSDDDYDYYYYDSYASRLNRFYYYTPFDYYDDFYYDYAPYGGGFYGGVGFGLGYYNPYWAWNPYGFGFGYSPYSYWGTGYGYGYGGGGYWGIYSAYRSYASTPGGRPYRGPGFPTTPGGQTRVGYSGAYPATMTYPGRPSVTTTVYGTRPTRGQGEVLRPVRDAISRPDYQPAFRPSSPSVSSGGSSSGGGSSNGGGGGRPSRP